MYREIRRLEARNWWFVGMRRIAEALLGDQRFGTALDLGCGSGGNLDLLERHADRVVACDLSPESIRGLDGVALLPPTYVVACVRRALKRWGLLRPYQQSLLDVPGPANAALTWLLSAEASLVQRVDLPAGVSLLVRARRP